MTDCTATLTVYGGEHDYTRHEMRCWGHAGHEGRHRCGGLLWEDTVPGATPHRDPEPRYVAEPFEGGPVWQVVREGSDLAAAKFFMDSHPDPQGAAEVHAQYLNGDGGPELLARVALQREQNVRAERDRYTAALEKIAREAKRTAGGERVSLLDLVHSTGAFARRVLDGGDA